MSWASPRPLALGVVKAGVNHALLLVPGMTPETQRSTRRQAEGATTLEGRTAACRKMLGRLTRWSESLIKLGYSWFSAKDIQVSGTGNSQVKYTTLVGRPNRSPGGW